MQTIATLADAAKCGEENQAKVFYFSSYPQLFHQINYYPVIGFMAKIISYIISISWAYRDLFLINISFAFISRFEHFNEKLFAMKGKAMLPGKYWDFRCHYLTIKALVDEFDDAISAITLLALFKNIFILCAHFFTSFQ
jgi:Trehalose receptor